MADASFDRNRKRRRRRRILNSVLNPTPGAPGLSIRNREFLTDWTVGGCAVSVVPKFTDLGGEKRMRETECQRGRACVFELVRVWVLFLPISLLLSTSSGCYAWRHSFGFLLIEIAT